MFLTFAIIYILFTLIVLLCSHYIILFSSHDQYTRSELTDFSPFLQKLGRAVGATGSSPAFLAAVIVFSLIGMAIPYLVRSWITHSVIIFLIVCLLLPLIKNMFLSPGVDSTDRGREFIKNFITRYHQGIALGFGTGTGSMIVYNFRDLKEINPFFLAINILAVIAINCFIIIRMLQNRD